MATVLTLGPADHGKPMALETFEKAHYREGYEYELVDGKVYVAAKPEVAQAVMEGWLFWALNRYSEQHPEVINFVWSKVVLYIDNRPGATCLQPDMTACRDVPLHLPPDQVHWRDLIPVVTAEVVAPDDPAKALIRNVELYLGVPTIQEYWVIDNLRNAEQPEMIVFRRHGSRWETSNVRFGETYTTRLLPGFELPITPRSWYGAPRSTPAAE